MNKKVPYMTPEAIEQDAAALLTPKPAHTLRSAARAFA